MQQLHVEGTGVVESVGGDHDFKQCQVEKTKCCNCGGNHITSFRGCESHITAVGVEKVRAGKDMSYAEAIRQVKWGPVLTR